MKRIILICFMAGTVCGVGQASTNAVPDDAIPEIIVEEETADNNIYEKVDVVPQFPGGESAMMRHVARNIRYPIEAMESHVQGRVVVRFVVERDGSVSNVKISKSVDTSLDKEAMRVVKTLPRFIPGQIDGKPVRSQMSCPVNFRL